MASVSPKVKWEDRDIDQTMEGRIRELREKNPSICLDHLTVDDEHGRWGVIIYTDYNFETMGLEFIESSGSWHRPEVVDQYNGLVSEGYCVVIYAPSSDLAELASLLKRAGGRPNLRLAPIEDTSHRAHTLKEM